MTPYLLKTDGNPEGVDVKVFEDIEANLRKDRPAFLKEFGPKFYGRSMVHHTVSEPTLEWTQQMALTGSLRSTLATAKSWSTTDFREEMKQITIPVLVIHGTGDNTVPIDASGRRSAKILPNATLTEYEGEPHGLFLTAADRLNAELLQFVGGPTRAHQYSYAVTWDLRRLLYQESVFPQTLKAEGLLWLAQITNTSRIRQVSNVRRPMSRSPSMSSPEPCSTLPVRWPAVTAMPTGLSMPSLKEC